MYLITSAAYVSQELRNEIGNLPPAFLPIKNQRLFFYQLETINLKEDIYLSIPEDYQIEEFDNFLLKKYNINLIRVPINFSLGKSIFYSLNAINKEFSSIKILHGDTLILDIPDLEDDFIIASKSIDDYDWSKVMGHNTDLIYSGFFNIKDINFLKELLEKNEFDFMLSIDKYFVNRNVQLFESQKWLDFGHINTFFRSKASMPNVRHFNSLEINTRTVIKRSLSNNNKIIAEYKWFEDIPLSIKYFTPQLVNKNGDSEYGFYELEYLYFLSLNELFVYSKLPKYKWEQIFNAAKYFLNICNNYKPNSITSYLNNDIYLKKTIQRIDLFLSENAEFNKVLSYNGNKIGTLKEIAIKSSEFISIPKSDHISIVHGDFCFSNILFDFRRQDIKIIDPRGINVKGEFDIYGDQRYEYSKLAHSVIGLYDYIISEKYYLKESNLNYLINFPDEDEIEEIQNIFWNKFIDESMDKKFIYASMVQLFLSMLPLHKDSFKRQNAIIANCLRLFIKLESL